MLFSCDDGNFEVPSMEFESSISECGDLLLYRLNDAKTEAIAISLLESNLIQETGEKILNLGSSTKVTYLIFDSKVGSSYFCNDIPSTSPKVLQSYIGISGKLVLNSVEITNTDNEITGYSYNIVLTDLILDNGSDKIGFESFDFGEIERDL